MAFSEKTKSIVKKKSHIQCCLCKEIGIEIHHIIPQNENGPDDESNAAPLCPTCHEIYGDNPKKRKFITEARDLWYEICETRYRFDTKEIIDIKNTLKGLPTTATLQEIKDQIISAVKPTTSKITDLIGTLPAQDDNEIVKELDIYDLLTYLYHSRSKRNDKNHEIILMPELWSEGDVLEVLSDFTKQFGYSAATLIVNRIMDEIGIPEDEGLTEPEIEAVMTQAFIEMILYIGCLNNKVKAKLRKTGEIVWQRIE